MPQEQVLLGWILPGLWHGGQEAPGCPSVCPELGAPPRAAGVPGEAASPSLAPLQHISNEWQRSSREPEMLISPAGLRSDKEKGSG